jgi:comEA protein
MGVPADIQASRADLFFATRRSAGTTRTFVKRCHDEEDTMTRTLMAALAAMALSTVAIGAQGKAPAAKAVASATAPVNLNTATAEQLATIPGVGPKMAERIIDYRQKNGSFKKLEDLMNVSGIGEKNFLKMKPLITVTPTAASKQVAAAPGQ